MSADYPSMTTAEIRSKFLNFFEERGLKLYPSSSLVPDDPSLLLANAGMNQFKEYYQGKKTMKEIGADKPMLIYIISYFFYIDGVHTIISMSTSYGTNLGLDSAGMLLALLLVQVLGLPFCLLYMKLAEKFGARTMVGVGICVYMFICVFAFFMNSLWQFWMLAVLCAMLAVGLTALGGWALVLAAGCVFARYYVVAKNQFGGVTGDLAGWFLQKCEIWMLAALAACQWLGVL